MKAVTQEIFVWYLHICCLVFETGKFQYVGFLFAMFL